MCVIIDRNPNVTIDHEKLISAAKVNPDGYGVSIIDRGKMETIHNFSAKGNDPDEIIKIFEDAKGFRLFAHLRFSTKGEKNVSNCHPFEVFSDGDYKIMFMHNGTLSQFGSKESSDSKEFSEEILKPMFRAFYEIEGEGVLVDPKFTKIIEHFRNGGSVFNFYDSNGESLKLGKGFEHEGWWSSNEYSFNRNHREPSTPFRNTTNTTHYGGTNNVWRGSKFSPIFRADVGEYGWWDHNVWYVDIVKTNEHKKKREELENTFNNQKKEKDTTKAVSTQENNVVNLIKKEEVTMEKLTENECSAIGQAINTAVKKNVLAANHVPPSKRLTFCELADLSSLEDISILTKEEILELVETLPLATTILLMDLIYELYTSKAAERVEKARVKLEETKKTEEKDGTNG